MCHGLQQDGLQLNQFNALLNSHKERASWCLEIKKRGHCSAVVTIPRRSRQVVNSFDLIDTSGMDGNEYV